MGYRRRQASLMAQCRDWRRKALLIKGYIDSRPRLSEMPIVQHMAWQHKPGFRLICRFSTTAALTANWHAVCNKNGCDGCNRSQRYLEGPEADTVWANSR